MPRVREEKEAKEYFLPVLKRRIPGVKKGSLKTEPYERGIRGRRGGKKTSCNDDFHSLVTRA